MIGTQGMYKESYANGREWYEWIKMAPHKFIVYKVYGDGSITKIYDQETKVMAKKSCGFLNKKFTTEENKQFMRDEIAVAEKLGLVNETMWLFKEDR